MIDLSDLLTDDEPEVLPNGTRSPYTPEHAEAAAHALGFESAEQRDELTKPKRKRRTKAEMEAARAAETAPQGTVFNFNHMDNLTSNAEAARAAEAPTHEEKLAELDARDAALDEGEPTPFDDVEVSTVTLEDVPDATDTQVLIDELHYLREDIRENTLEVRKLALALERYVEAGGLGKAA